MNYIRDDNSAKVREFMILLSKIITDISVITFKMIAKMIIKVLRSTSILLEIIYDSLNNLKMHNRHTIYITTEIVKLLEAMINVFEEIANEKHEIMVNKAANESREAEFVLEAFKDDD